MTYQIILQLDGIDFNSPVVTSIITRQLRDFAWRDIDGRVTVTMFEDDGENVVERTLDQIDRIERCVPGAHVRRVDEDLVGISDIANRVGVSREAARSWVTGSRGPRGFPAPRGSIGGGAKGSQRVWAWADVNEWLENHLGRGDGYRRLAQQSIARLNWTLDDRLVVAAHQLE